MPPARSVMVSPDTTAVKSSLVPDARRWRLEGLSELLGGGRGERESDERFRLRFLGEDERETESPSSTPRFIDREIRSGDVFATGAGGGLRIYSLLRKSEMSRPWTHLSFSSVSESSDSDIPDNGERGPFE